MTQKARAFRDIREVDGKYYAVDSRFSELSGYETMVFPCSSFRKELDFKRGFCLRKSPDERTMKWQHEEILRNIASYVRKGASCMIQVEELDKKVGERKDTSM